MSIRSSMLHEKEVARIDNRLASSTKSSQMHKKIILLEETMNAILKFLPIDVKIHEPTSLTSCDITDRQSNNIKLVSYL